MDLPELTTAIVAKGEEIRQLKGAKAAKEAIDKAVAELLDLKERYKVANNGTPYDPPKVEAPKKEKAAPAPAPVREGPSKKELNKQARKEKRSGGGGADEEVAAGAATALPTPPAAAAAAAAAAVAAAPAPAPAKAAAAASSNTPPTVFFSSAFAPELARTVSTLLDSRLIFTSQADGFPIPHLYCGLGTSALCGDSNISRYLVRASSKPEAAGLYGNGVAWLSSEIDQWLDVYTAHFSSKADRLSSSIVPVLNNHLATRTYLVGHSLTLADLALSHLTTRVARDSLPVHVQRWLSLVQSQIPSAAEAKRAAGLATSVKGKPKAAAASAAGAAGGGGAAAATAIAEEDEGGTCPPLEDAVEGQVCTRFPPEPSGYLHIGHAKAVLLNQYYAQRYKGRLLVRFDDTNPSKEKDEFADNIIQDLATLGVKADSVSHTSDHFARCEDLARQIIRDGLAYMDDTDQETMQAERMERKESVRRNATVEENLKLFEALLKGETAEAKKFCLRAKIDMGSVNGTMRDPVLYRSNDTPHLRTGSKFKAYPTYDFACPIVDSVEGVTHALRTTEYNDRDEQYHWIQNALRLRRVHIQAFGKMNFVHTVLSKRKLNWFVENNLVEGWFDPRFPTIQGCVRRGVNVEALKNFIISQGASRRVITMEWDKFWAENKKVLEETAPRFMGISVPDQVLFTVTNVGDEDTAVSVQIHPQKPEHGLRVMRRSNKLYVDQADALTYKEGEEVTFLRWGNFVIDRIVKDESGKVLSMEGRYNADATNFSKTKKTTWLAAVSDLVPCQIVEFDHLISKAKLGDEENFKDFVNPVTRTESAGLCDPCVRSLQEGAVIQLERKGFFRVDKAYGGSAAKPLVLFVIPDGKQKAGAAPPAPAPGKKGKK